MAAAGRGLGVGYVERKWKSFSEGGEDSECTGWEVRGSIAGGSGPGVEMCVNDGGWTKRVVTGEIW